MGKTTFVQAQDGGITDAIGRYRYLTSEEEQEHLVCSFSNVNEQFWHDLQLEGSIGSKSKVALEYQLMIPNSLKDNLGYCEKVCKEFIAQELGPYGIGYTCGLHDNPKNLHLHVMFSERTLDHPENNPTITYHKDRPRNVYYLDFVNKFGEPYSKVVKKSVYDKHEGPKHVERTEGKVIQKLENPKFSKKNEYLSSEEFLENFKLKFTDLCNKMELEMKSGLEWDRNMPEGHKAQMHVGKNVTPEVKAYREAYNEEVKEYNRLYDEMHSQEIKTNFKDLALEELQKMKEEVTKIYNEIKEQLTSVVEMVAQGTLFAQLGKLFDEGEALEKQATTLEQHQSKFFEEVGAQFDEGDKLDIKANELEQELDEALEKTLEHSHSIGGHTL